MDETTLLVECLLPRARDPVESYNPYDLDTLEIPEFQRPPPALLHRRFRMRFGQLAGLLLR